MPVEAKALQLSPGVPVMGTSRDVNLLSEQNQLGNGVRIRPYDSVLSKLPAERSGRFKIQAKRKKTLFPRPCPGWVAALPLTYPVRVTQLAMQPVIKARARRQVFLIALGYAEWIAGGDESPTSMTGGGEKPR